MKQISDYKMPVLCFKYRSWIICCVTLKSQTWASPTCRTQVQFCNICSLNFPILRIAWYVRGPYRLCMILANPLCQTMYSPFGKARWCRKMLQLQCLLTDGDPFRSVLTPGSKVAKATLFGLTGAGKHWIDLPNKDRTLRKHWTRPVSASGVVSWFLMCTEVSWNGKRPTYDMRKGFKIMRNQPFFSGNFLGIGVREAKFLGHTIELFAPSFVLISLQSPWEVIHKWFFDTEIQNQHSCMVSTCCYRCNSSKQNDIKRNHAEMISWVDMIVKDFSRFILDAKTSLVAPLSTHLGPWPSPSIFQFPWLLSR